MATTRRSSRAAMVRTPADDEIKTGDVAPGEEVDAEEDAIAELRGLGAADEYKFTVSRISSTPGKPAGYCATYGAGDLSLDAIRESFGGGKYRIRVTDAGGKYVNMRTVEIVDLPRKDVATAVAAAAVQPDMQGIASLISALKPGADSGGVTTLMPLLLAMMSNQTESLKTMMTAMMSAQKGPSITELLALVQSNKAGGDGESAVSMLLKGLELGKELGGGEAGMLDVAKEGLGVLSALTQQQAQRPALPAPSVTPRPMLPRVAGNPAAPTLAPPAAAVANNQPEGAQPVGVVQKINWLKGQVNVLLIQAARGKSAELYAEVMLDNLPPFITPAEMLERLQADDAIEQLTLLDGRVAQHAEWFEEFRQAVIEFLTEEDDDEEGEQPAGSVALGDPLVGGVEGDAE
jgi:hypothetical protein